MTWIVLPTSLLFECNDDLPPALTKCHKCVTVCWYCSEMSEKSCYQANGLNSPRGVLSVIRLKVLGLLLVCAESDQTEGLRSPPHVC